MRRVCSVVRGTWEKCVGVMCGNGGGSSLVGKACFLQRCMQRPTYIETQEFNFRASRERYRDH